MVQRRVQSAALHSPLPGSCSEMGRPRLVQRSDLNSSLHLDVCTLTETRSPEWQATDYFSLGL